MKSIITSHWQYITNDKLGDELYDWREDPQELHNLATSSEGQQISRELLRVCEQLSATLLEARGRQAISREITRTG
jgi:hypothetical protein